MDILNGFAERWFLLLYPAYGVLLLGAALMLHLRKESFWDYLMKQFEEETPPALWLQLLRSLMLLSVVSLGFSALNWDLINFFFSIWSLVILFLVGKMLVVWPQSREIMKQNPAALYQKLGKITLQIGGLGLIMFLLFTLQLRQDVPF